MFQCFLRVCLRGVIFCKVDSCIGKTESVICKFAKLPMSCLKIAGTLEQTL